DLDRLADRDAERTRRARVLAEDLLPGLRRRRRRRTDLRAERLHEDPAIGLLLERRLDHEDQALQAEEAAGHRERGAPLAGAGLGGHTPDARLLVVVGLGDRGVRLVRAGR